MNRIYKVIWSRIKQSFVVVSECSTSTQGKNAVRDDRCVRSALSGIKRGVVAAVILLALTGQAFAADDDVYVHVNTGELAQGAGNSDTNLGKPGDKGGALGNYSVTIGVGAVTATAPGASTPAVGESSIAIGKDSGSHLTTTYNNRNIAIGEEAGQITRAQRGVAIGTGAGQYINTGDDSVSLGTDAGSNVVGGVNVSIGKSAGNRLVGQDNVAIGSGAGKEIYGGSNISLGAGAGVNFGEGNFTDQSGAGNYPSGSATKAADNNISIGLRANNFDGGDSLKTGNNIALGVNSTASGKSSGSKSGQSIAIGISALADVANSIALGSETKALTTDSVALGSNSVADRAALTAGATTDSAASAAAGTVYAPAIAGNAAKTAVSGTVKGTFGAVSVGDVDNTRQIINVAAGSDDTDAVNVAQLKAVANAAEAGATGYFHVNEANPGQGKGNDTTNFGAVRDKAGATGDHSIAAGIKALASEVNAVAIGANSQATKDDSVAIGNASKASNTANVAVGKNAQGTGSYSVAIGLDSITIGNSSVAMGSGTNATGNYTVAIGNNALATQSGAITMGSGSQATADHAVALGNDAHATVEGAVAIGKDTWAKHAKSVALGANAETKEFNQITNVEINGITYDGFAGAAKTENGGVVSIGKAEAEKQIVNLAPGDISATSTDAVNGSQLFAITNDLQEASQTYFHFNDPDMNQGAGDATANLGGITNRAGATGEYSLTAGVGAQATAEGGIALGYKAKAEGEDAVVIGGNGTNSAKGLHAVAIGSTTKASAAYSTAMGNGTSAEGENSVAMGYKTTVTDKGQYATAMGNATTASAIASTATGNATTASGNFSMSMGIETVASGGQSVAMGKKTKAYGESSVAMGFDTTASGTNSLATGTGTTASKPNSTAMGDQTTASGMGATSMGSLSTASGTVATSMGTSTIAEGDNSTAMGSGSKASGFASVAAGEGSKTSAESAIAMGSGSEASEKFAVAMGYLTKASAESAIAMGSSSKASDFASVAMGDQSKASGFTSVAMGYKSAASGSTSVAMGNQSKAIGDGSLATDGGIAYTTDSMALGYGTVAGKDTGDEEAVAMGYRSKAEGNKSLALGFDAKATHENSVALGEQAETKDFASVANTTVGGVTYDGFAGTANGVVSVGKTGVEKQIVNVAPGTITATSTDAINGSQLFAVADKLNDNIQEASQTYFHFNDPAMTQGTGDATTNLGGVTDIAGATGNYAVTAGAQASASGINSVAIGFNAQASQNDVIAVGNNAQGTGVYSVAIGKDVQAQGESSIAIGNNANTTFNQATAIGNSSSATAPEATALGSAAYAQAGRSTAIGNNTRALVFGSSALGGYSTAGAEKAMALGYQSNAKIVDSVALGSSSVADVSAGAVGADPLNVVTNKADSIWTSTYAAVSVGDINNDITRQINSVAAGTQDTDAVNVAQLNTVANHTKNVGSTITGILGGGAAISPQGSIIMSNIGGTGKNTVHEAIESVNTTANAGFIISGVSPATTADAQIKPNETFKIAGDFNNDDFTRSDAGKNIYTVVNEDNTVTVGLAKDLEITSVTTGDTVFKDGSLLVNSAETNTDKQVSLTADGLNNGEKQITNVASGGDTDSNGANIGDVKSAVSDSSWQIAGNDKSAVGNVNPDEQVNFLNGNATTAAVAADGNDFTVSYNVNVDNKTVEIAGDQIKAKTTTLTTDITDGTVTAGDTDALSTAGDIATAINSSSFRVKANDDEGELITPGDNVDLVAGDHMSITRDGSKFTFTADTQGIAEAAQLPVVYTNTEGKRVYRREGKFYDDPTAGNEVPATGIIASMQNAEVETTTPTRLTNVAAGAIEADSTDAINGGQLFVAAAAAKEEVISTDQSISIATTTNGSGANVYDLSINTDETTIEVDGATGKVKARTDSISVVDGKAVASTSTSLATSGDIADAINQSGFTVKANGDIGELITPGDTVEFIDGDNIEITTTGGQFTVNTAKEVSFDSVTTGDTKVNTDGVTISNGAIGNSVTLGKSGLNNGGNKITNIADGNISATSTDAINGSQLFTITDNLQKGSQTYFHFNDPAMTTQGVGDATTNLGGVTDMAGATGDYSVTAGVNAKASKEGGIAIGYNSQATANNSLSLGVNAIAADEDSIALGEQAETKAFTQVANVTVGGVTYGNFLGTANGVVSVGKIGAEKQIVNVAPGAITATSTDAVNGSQLFVTQTVIGNMADSVKTVLGGDAAVGTDGKVSMTNIGGTSKETVHEAIEAVNNIANTGFTISGASLTTAADAQIKPNETFKIAGDSNNRDFTRSDAGKNIYTVVNENNTVTIGLANDLEITSVKTQAVNATTGITLGDAADPRNSTTLTSGANGLDIGGDRITNVGSGDISATSTDAINGSQLFAAAEGSKEKVESTDKSVTITTTQNAATGSTIYDLEVQVDAATMAFVDVDPADPSKGKKLTTVTSNITSNPAGAATADTPTALATAGEIASAINNSGFTAKANGDAGAFITPGDEVEFTNGDNIEITRTGGQFTVKTAKDVGFDSVTTGDTLVNADGVTISNGAAGNPVTLGKSGLDNGGNKITNIAAGEISSTSTDAVNGSQVFALVAGSKEEVRSTDQSVTVTRTQNAVTGVDIFDLQVQVNAATMAFVDVDPADPAKGRKLTAVTSDITNDSTGVATAVMGSSLTTAGNVAQAINNAGWIGTAGVGIDGGIVQGTGDERIKTGEKVTFDAGKNIKLVQKGQTFTYATRDNVAFNKVTTGDTEMTSSGVIAPSYATNGKHTITISGDTGIINGLTNTTFDPKNYTSGQAATEDQLASLNEVVHAGFNVTANGSNPINTGPGETIDFNNRDGNILVQNKGGSLTSDLNPDLNVNSVTTGNTQINTNGLVTKGGPSVTTKGIDAADKPITNVARGTRPGDAVNLAQLEDADDRASKGTAAALAAASMPQAYAPGTSLMTAGIGTYRGKSAIAIGYSTMSDNGKWILQGSVSANEDDAGLSVGVGYQW
ncbi:MAG: hypothetical protein CSA25_05075 [Desulfobacter postgatei]|uniref:Uncharacterized protein n=1 Tax=Desulfobacter postgatei TaxID=2293 RepID=A0A2G6MQV5_9BACT|nr:MAG: hypothetical protein CSA25_05075 [Desulfobacter postgatei]